MKKYGRALRVAEDFICEWTQLVYAVCIIFFLLLLARGALAYVAFADKQGKIPSSIQESIYFMEYISTRRIYNVFLNERALVQTKRCALGIYLFDCFLLLYEKLNKIKKTSLLSFFFRVPF